MDCPKCKHVMESMSYGMGDREVFRCTDCFGMWLKPIDMQRLKNTFRADLIDEGSPRVGKKQNVVDEVDCPVCGVRMDKTADPDQTHIWYESCPEGHGMYLDAGELKDYNNDTIGDFFKKIFTGSR